MKFKKLTLSAIIAVSQTGMLLPAYAEPVNQLQSAPSVTQEVYAENQEQDVIQGGLEITNPEQSESNEQQGSLPQTGSKNELVLLMNSNKMYQDGQLYLANQPMTVKKGVSYVSIRAIVERVGVKLTYDSKTKETIITRGEDELRFKTNSSVYKVNGVSKTMKGTAYQEKNVFMVPLTSITQALNIPYKVDNAQKRVILSLVQKPTASFTIEQKEIFAGQTQVTYLTQSSSPTGAAIVNERWEGRQDVFATPGTYTISYAVQDEHGEWSDPYTVTVEVLVPNQPPVAMFVTDKEQYQMGELITITDQSTDDTDKSEDLQRSWDNKALAFFTPGPKTIKLTVTDSHGAVSEYEKTILITNETLYNRDDFNKLFTPVGEKYSINGGQVPGWSKVPFQIVDEPSTLIRSNSPETVYSEGILYRERALGPMRFMVHHVNALDKDVKMYVIATNINYTTATLNIIDQGFAGPSPFATAAGKVSVKDYFDSIQTNRDAQTITLEPGESKIIFDRLNAQKIKPGQVISLLADAHTDVTMEYTVIMVEADRDPLEAMPTLPFLERDIHNRGTYKNSTRVITHSELVGETNARLLIGDNKEDPNLLGSDGVTGEWASNAGNFGVLYKIVLERVAPNTLITFNPRGGTYSGYVLVNGSLVAVSSAGPLSAPNENSVLHRTGFYEQRVEIWFTAAPGSNLPVNLLFTQLPERK